MGRAMIFKQSANEGNITRAAAMELYLGRLWSIRVERINVKRR